MNTDFSKFSEFKNIYCYWQEDDGDYFQCKYFAYGEYQHENKWLLIRHSSRGIGLRLLELQIVQNPKEFTGEFLEQEKEFLALFQ